MNAVAIARRARLPRIILDARMRAALWALTAAVFAASIVAYASIPTGAATAAGVVPHDGRLVVSRSVGTARVMLIARPQRLEVITAVKRAKGWFGVRAGGSALDGIAFVSTPGTDDVPAFSALFGKGEGARVEIVWADGLDRILPIESDGTFLAVHPGTVAATKISMIAADGKIIRSDGLR